VSRPLELKNPLWFNTPKGPARAHFLIADNEQDLLWICFLQDGVCWTFSNQDIRIMDNATIGRTGVDKLGK